MLCLSFPDGDATGLPRGNHDELLQDIVRLRKRRCHGLAPWSFTLVATRNCAPEEATMPRACPVVFHAGLLQDIVRLRKRRCHGLAPWSFTLLATGEISKRT